MSRYRCDILDPRQEAFAQAIARGASQVEAGREAGYRGTGLTTLRRRPKIALRIAELKHDLQAPATIAPAIKISRTVAKARKDAAVAAAAASAATDVADITREGLIVDLHKVAKVAMAKGSVQTAGDALAKIVELQGLGRFGRSDLSVPATALPNEVPRRSEEEFIRGLMQAAQSQRWNEVAKEFGCAVAPYAGSGIPGSDEFGDWIDTILDALGIEDETKPTPLSVRVNAYMYDENGKLRDRDWSGGS